MTEDSANDPENQPVGSDDRPQEDSHVTDADGSGGAHVVSTGEDRTVMMADGSKGGVEEDAEREVDNKAHQRSSEEEERQNEQERDLIGDQLQADVLAAIKDLRECMIYHDI